MRFAESWRQRARALKKNSFALYLAARDRRVPWYAKVVIAIVAAYALSPIDLIPDFIPILGLVDDLLLLPIGIALAIRLTPSDVWQECVARAEEQQRAETPRSVLAAAVIVVVWIVAIVASWLLLSPYVTAERL